MQAAQSAPINDAMLVFSDLLFERARIFIDIVQQHALQGWDTYPLLLRNSLPYIDDLHHARERLQSQASLLFVKDPQKISLEILSHCDDGNGGLTFIHPE